MPLPAPVTTATFSLELIRTSSCRMPTACPCDVVAARAAVRACRASRPAGQPLPSLEQSARHLGLAGLYERPDPLDLLANALDDDTARGQDPQSRSGQRAETGTTGARTRHAPHHSRPRTRTNCE